jgi:hypothetical protein
MKKYLFLLVVCVSCVSSSQETASSADSATADVYEDFSEVGPFTIKDDIRETKVTIGGKSRSLKEFLSRFYNPDTYTPHMPEDSLEMPQYIITEANVIEGGFFSEGGSCQNRSLLLAGRGNFVDQEFYDLFFLTVGTDGEMVVSGKETFDGSQGQSSTIVNVTKEDLAVDRKCKVLKVSSASEGGDINLHKDEWEAYYVADQKGFHAVLKLQIEKTDIQDYEATQDENQNSSSETREVDFLESSSNGLYDIRAKYVSRQNGATIANEEEVYTFNGKEYVRK